MEELNVQRVEVKAPREVTADARCPAAEANHKNGRNREEL